MSIRYVNVDCILHSDNVLSEAIDFLRSNVFCLWEEVSVDSRSFGLETNLVNSEIPEEDISEFVRLFESLPPDLRRLIDLCTEKTFDIGFEGGVSENVLDTTLSASMIEKIHEFGFSVPIRIYPAAEEHK